MKLRTSGWLVLVAMAALSVLVGLAMGALRTSLADVTYGLAEAIGLVPAGTVRREVSAVLIQVRAPRVFATFLVGAVLGVSGATMQGLFRNPLADPGLVGVMAGASLGAAISIVLVGDGGAFGIAAVWLTPIAAFAGGLSATAASLVLSRSRTSETSLLLLAGVAVQAIAFAGLGFLTYLAKDAALRDLTFWLLGSFSGATWSRLGASLPILLLALGVAPFFTRSLDAMLFGEDVARDAGVSVAALRVALVLVTSAGVGAAVAVAGPISFVGLVVPHLVRLVAGVRHAVVLPASALLGATLMVCADTVARTVAAPAEMPVGVVTAFAGAPVLAWLLRRAATRGSQT